MLNNNDKNIFDYAKELEPKSHLLTFFDVCKILLKNLDCIVCMESAADLLGYSNLGFRDSIYVYSEKELNKPYIKCFIVKDLEKIPYRNEDGIKYSPIENAINDMLARNDTNPQVLYETFADYYFRNNESYDKLEIPKKLILKAKHYQEEGARYYEQ